MPDVVTTRLSKSSTRTRELTISTSSPRRTHRERRQGQFVCDPYLDQSAQAATCKALLAKLNDKSHAARTLRDQETVVDRPDRFSVASG